MSFEQMYQEQILDHYKNPRNSGSLQNPDIKYSDTNPLCGDEVEFTAKVKDDKITEVKFNCKGCAISKAASSMLTDAVKGKSLDDVRKMTKDEILGMLGVQISPVRMKCAMLGLKTLQKGIYKYLGKEKK
ncbi:MAG TPA: SUF system NifU family Fe-S cluster assembly protein [Candidatus Nanoarchaeia archaeon]|nr:SUF system NifU family Fe-S cluster assembly protein [Candidatus Nanoarchaeia archaeon]